MLESELEQLRDGMTEPRRDAWFRAAEGGTLVLDGVDGLPIPAQANLLRVFQEPGARASRDHEWESRGVRVVATATRDLAELAASGAFLQPLIFRLNTVHFHVPRVVEREGDLYLLAVHFLREMAPPSSVARRSLSPRAWRALSQYRFPGNVAELEAALQTGLSLADGGEIDLEHLPPAIREMQDRGD
jgi:DNA-binding NtrC family response regulator